MDNKYGFRRNKSPLTINGAGLTWLGKGIVDGMLGNWFSKATTKELSIKTPA